MPGTIINNLLRRPLSRINLLAKVLGFATLCFCGSTGGTFLEKFASKRWSKTETVPITAMRQYFSEREFTSEPSKEGALRYLKQNPAVLEELLKKGEDKGSLIKLLPRQVQTNYPYLKVEDGKRFVFGDRFYFSEGIKGNADTLNYYPRNNMVFDGSENKLYLLQEPGIASCLGSIDGITGAPDGEGVFFEQGNSIFVKYPGKPIERIAAGNGVSLKRIRDLNHPERYNILVVCKEGSPENYKLFFEGKERTPESKQCLSSLVSSSLFDASSRIFKLDNELIFNSSSRILTRIRSKDEPKTGCRYASFTSEESILDLIVGKYGNEEKYTFLVLQGNQTIASYIYNPKDADFVPKKIDEVPCTPGLKFGSINLRDYLWANTPRLRTEIKGLIQNVK